MGEKMTRKISFYLLVIFIPMALIGGLLKWAAPTARTGPTFIIIGLIGAMLGFILLKIAGPPRLE